MTQVGRIVRSVLRGVAVTCVVAGAGLFALQIHRHSAVAEQREPSPRATSNTSARGANFADPELVSAFLGGAASDIAAVTTYDYRTLPDALNAGLAVTTGAYRAAYRAALTGDVGRTAIAQHAVHTFEMLNIGIGEMNAAGTRAKVLVFGRQSVTDDLTNGQTQTSPVTLCATIRRDGDLFRISDLVEGANAGLPPGGPDLRVAAEAGRSEVANLLSYRRADFDVDLQRAVAGATSPLSEEIQNNAADTRAAMTTGQYDLTGTVTAIAVVSASANAVTLLVTADATRIPDGSAEPVITHPRYVVAVIRTPLGWATSRVTPVDGT